MDCVLSRGDLVVLVFVWYTMETNGHFHHAPTTGS